MRDWTFGFHKPCSSLCCIDTALLFTAQCVPQNNANLNSKAVERIGNTFSGISSIKHIHTLPWSGLSWQPFACHSVVMTTVCMILVPNHVSSRAKFTSCMPYRSPLYRHTVTDSIPHPLFLRNFNFSILSRMCNCYVLFVFYKSLFLIWYPKIFPVNFLFPYSTSIILNFNIYPVIFVRNNLFGY